MGRSYNSSNMAVLPKMQSHLKELDVESSRLLYATIKRHTAVFRRVQLGKKIYVLHAFQKKSKKGIQAPKQDVETIKRRYKEAKELAKDED